MLQLDDIVVAAPDQVSCDLGGEAAILSTKTGMYYGLDPVGAFVWSHLGRPITVAQLRDAVLAEYDVAPNRCEEDLLALLGDLANEQLIRIGA